jgi:hypothetical protein
MSKANIQVVICEFNGVPMARHEFVVEEGSPVVGQVWAECVKAAIDKFATTDAGLVVDQHLRVRFEHGVS